MVLVAALGTGPARVPGIHPENHAAPPCGLVVQHPEEGAPTLIEEGEIETDRMPEEEAGRTR